MEKVTVVIMNHAVAAQSFKYFDHTDWLADPRVEIVPAEDEQEIKVPFAAVPSCLQLASDAAARLRDLVFLELSTPFTEKRLHGLKESWRPRLQENLPFVQADGDVASLFGARPGERIIVAGAGPTLSTHYEWLHGQTGKSVIVAVDAALKPLLAGGVQPDFVVSIDGLPVVARFFQDIKRESLRKSTLVYAPILYSEILKTWPGPRFVSYLAGEDFDPQFAREYPRGCLFSSGSVIHPAVDLAVMMGAGEVILLGADFSFPGGQTHVAGCFRSADRKGVANSHWVISGEGERVATSTNFRGFLRDLERYILKHPEVRFVNGSRLGARIEGTFDLHGEKI